MEKIDMVEIGYLLGSDVAILELIMENMSDELCAVNKHSEKDHKGLEAKNFVNRANTLYAPALDLLLISLRDLQDKVNAATE